VPTTPNLTGVTTSHDSPVTAIIVGGSLSWLTTALTLARVGVQVIVIERSDDIGRTGAVLLVPDGLLDRMNGLGPSRLPRPLAPGIQTWFAVHASLRSAVMASDRITLHSRTTALRVSQDERAAWVHTADHEPIGADVVNGADGYRSVVRRHVAPDKPDAIFAGYVIWIGVADESAVAPERWPTDVAFFGVEDGVLLGYPLPGEDGSVSLGRRRLGWVWYDAGRNGVLRATGCVDGTVVQHSLLSDGIPSSTYDDLAVQARQELPAPWLGAMLDSIDRRAVIGTPIAEYVPDRLVQGRVALAGDAAHVSTPMTGSSFSAGLDDAEALAAAIAATPTSSGSAAGLNAYQATRLSSARTLVLSGQGFSRSLADHAA
jgi:2-polyprenyl-6-methoxyphenol hydroxylase-like FAD-dependent oxidoreductase